MAKRKNLIFEKVEDHSKKIFENDKDKKIIIQYIGNKHGVYALYDEKKLYYVGRAINLAKRIKEHLKDQHSANWDRFSLYFTKEAKYINSLEALIIAIAQPNGNEKKPRLGGKKMKMQQFIKKDLKESRNEHIRELVGGKHHNIRKKSKTTIKSNTKKSTSKFSLKNYFKKDRPLMKEYKGKTYQATLLTSGQIKYKNKLYNSPTSSAQAVIKDHSPNASSNIRVSGWSFWSIKGTEGNWMKLKDISNLVREKQENTVKRFNTKTKNSVWVKSKAKKRASKLSLKNYFKKDRPLMKEYKGKTYQATLLKSGQIKYKNKLYNSPTSAARAVIKDHSPNVASNIGVTGWKFWSVKDVEGNWIKLQDIANLVREKQENAVASFNTKTKNSVWVKSDAKKSTSRFSLKNYFETDRPLMKEYKGKTYQATLLTSGQIKYRNKLYNTPTSVAQAVIKDHSPDVASNTRTNGWSFWSVKNIEGKLVKLKDISNLVREKNKQKESIHIESKKAS